METELFSSQLTAAYASAAMMQWLKHKPWFPFLVEGNDHLNRAFAVVVAIGASVGIHFTFDAEAGSLMITGLILTNVLHAGWASIQQYAFQQFMFRSVIKPGESAK
jgi:hypothetical protein